MDSTGSHTELYKIYLKRKLKGFHQNTHANMSSVHEFHGHMNDLMVLAAGEYLKLGCITTQEHYLFLSSVSEFLNSIHHFRYNAPVCSDYKNVYKNIRLDTSQCLKNKLVNAIGPNKVLQTLTVLITDLHDAIQYSLQNSYRCKADGVEYDPSSDLSRYIPILEYIYTYCEIERDMFMQQYMSADHMYGNPSKHINKSDAETFQLYKFYAYAMFGEFKLLCNLLKIISSCFFRHEIDIFRFKSVSDSEENHLSRNCDVCKFIINSGHNGILMYPMYEQITKWCFNTIVRVEHRDHIKRMYLDTEKDNGTYDVHTLSVLHKCTMHKTLRNMIWKFGYNEFYSNNSTFKKFCSDEKENRNKFQIELDRTLTPIKNILKCCFEKSPFNIHFRNDIDKLLTDKVDIISGFTNWINMLYGVCYEISHADWRRMIQHKKNKLERRYIKKWTLEDA